MDYKKLIESQKSFLQEKPLLDLDYRIKKLKKLKSEIKNHEADIMEALKLDLNKSNFETFTTEIALVLEEINTNIKNIKKWAKPKKVNVSLINFPAKNYIYKEPYGVVLIISPWNYPFQLALAPLVGAIAAGNCAVIKPSEFSPKTSLIIEKIIKAVFKKEHVSVILGDVETSQYLLKEKFDYIFFTGSVAVGKIVMEAAAKNLTPVTLELGGKSPCIIDESADIKISAKRIVWGKFLNAGQTCIAPDYILVHKSIKEELINNLKYYINEFYGDKPIEDSHIKIINHTHFERLISYLSDGDILFGGNYSKDNLYIQPTLLYNVGLDSKVMNEEIFGPILPILEYSNLDEVISFVKSKPKPLALYFFSKNVSSQNSIISNLSFGGGCINDTIVHVADSNLPFGGVGDSGIGVYHGKSSFETFTHNKSILKKSFFPDIKLRYPPYTNKIKLLKKFFK